jgi:hypothetical protein
VHGDRHAGLDVGGRDGVLDAGLVGREAPLLDDALEERRLDARAPDALADVAQEHLGHRLVATEHGVRAPVVQEVRDLVERVEPGGDDDVEVDLGVDPRHARDVAAEPDHGGVDDRGDAEVAQTAQLVDRVGDPDLLVPVLVAVVLHDVGAQHEHVLVHQRRPEIADVHRTPHRLHRGHRPYLRPVVV